MKSYFRAILIGLVLWTIVNLLLFTNIVDFAIKQNNTLYIHLYHLLSYSIIGFVIGWYGKPKGLLLGLFFAIIVLMIVWISTFLTDMFKTAANDIGTFGALKRILVSSSTITIVVCSIFGGFIGSRVRKI